MKHLGKKIRNAQMRKVPYMIILETKKKLKRFHKKEMEKVENNINLKDFIESIKKKISKDWLRISPTIVNHLIFKI